MRDIQRERLKHLLTNAILELWKKETGSLSSVIIEGTICITPGSGKTTVVQVADRFGGSIQDEDVHIRDPQTPRRTHRYSGPLGMGSLTSPTFPEAPSVDTHNPQAMQSFLDNLSPASLVSPVTDYSRSSRERSRSPHSRSPSMDTQRQESNGKDKDNASDSGSDIVDNNNKASTPNQTPDRSYGGIIRGTGFYTPDSNRSTKSDTSPQSSALNLSSVSDSATETVIKEIKREPELRSDNKSNPADHMDTNKGVSDENHNDPNAEDAMDLTRAKDGDLALSPPQNYTAQVRDVIRQRLLATKSLSESDNDRDRQRFVVPKNLSESDTDKIDVLKSPEFSKSPDFSKSPEFSKPETPDKVPHSPVPTTSGMPPLIHHPAAHPLTMANSPFSLYNRQLAAMPILTGGHRGLVLNGPMQPMLKHKPLSIPPPMQQHPPSPHDSSLSPVSPVFMQTSPPTMVPVRDSNFMDMGSKETSPPPSGSSPTENDANGEQRVYKCEFCAKTFLFKSKYHEHLPVHTNARPFQCHLCSRTYKYKYDLRVHLRTHMGIPTKSTICPFCSGKFDTNKMLRMHIKEAHRDKQKASEEECTQSADNLPPAM